MQRTLSDDPAPSEEHVWALGRMFHLRPPQVTDGHQQQLLLMGREAARRLREDEPALYDQLVAALDRAGAFQMRAETLMSDLLRQGGASPSATLSALSIAPEDVCDVTGDLFMDPHVWNVLVGPKAAGQAQAWAKRVIEQERPSPRVLAHGSGSAVWDRPAAQRSFVNALQAWAASLQNTPREQALRATEGQQQDLAKVETVTGGLAAFGMLTSMTGLMGAAAMVGAAATNAPVGSIALVGALAGVVAFGASQASGLAQTGRERAEHTLYDLLRPVEGDASIRMAQ